MEDNVIILGAKHLTNIDYWLKVRIKDILKYDEIKEVVEPTKIIDEDYKEEPKKDSRLTIKVREIYNVNCSSCGKPTTVPFKPDGVRPVYCRECLRKFRYKRYNRR